MTLERANRTNLAIWENWGSRRNSSSVVVPMSKETSLFDPVRLFAAAIRAALVPGANDDVMTAVMARLRPNSELYDALEVWTTAEVQKGRLSALFAALLHLIPRTDPDDHARIARFFSGGKLNVTVAKGWLSAAGAAKLFDLKPVRKADARIAAPPFRAPAAPGSGLCRMVRTSSTKSSSHRSLQSAAAWPKLRRIGALAGVGQGRGNCGR